MITPEHARQMLLTAGADGFTAPEMLVTLELATQAPVMAEQIANMRFEYALEQTGVDGPEVVTRWLPHMGAFVGYPGRIVRRLVSDPEAVE